MNTLLLALFLNFAAIVFSQLNIVSWSGYGIYGLLAIFSFGLALLMTLYKRKRFMDELIDIDIRLGLDERLSTAYEYAQRGQQSEIGQVLLEEVSHLLAALDRKKVSSRNFSMVHFLIPVLGIAIAALLTFDFHAIIPTQGKIPRERLQQLGQELEDLAERGLSGTESAAFETEEERAQQTRALSKSLQDQAKSAQDLASEMEALLEDVRAERRQITDILESEMLDRNISDLALVSPTETDEVLTSHEFDKLLEQLENMLEQVEQQGSGDGFQLTIPRNLASLNRTLQLEQFLQNALDDINPDARADNTLTDQGIENFAGGQGQESGDQSGSEMEQGEFSASDDKPDVPPEGSLTENAGENQESRISNTQALLDELSGYLTAPPGGRPFDDMQEMPGYDDLAEGSKLSPSSDQRPGRGGAEDLDSGQDDSFSSIAGDQEGEFQGQEPDELSASTYIAIQDRTGAGQAERYHKMVRSLATIGSAEVATEEVIASFQKEVEAILQKEEIPAMYREYIRNYFISIGVKKEKK